MTTEYSQDIGEKRISYIDASKERSAMAKGGQSKTEGVQVSREEVHIKDNNDHTSHIYKMMVKGNEASGREINDCNEEMEHHDGGQDICTNKRTRPEEECNGSSGSATKSKGTTKRVLPKWFKRL